MFRSSILPILPLALALATGGAGAAEGVDVGQASSLRRLVPADALERQSARAYELLKRQAASQRTLAPAEHPQLRRLRRIAGELVPFAQRFNPRSAEWRWEVSLIASKQINAFCMPGGKIAFYTGILDVLRLSDDEVAMVMGHEIAHALREHARERIAKNQITQLGAGLLGQLVGRGQYAELFQLGGNLLSLRFSREDETEADIVGLDLAARAGYDPRAAITLWRKMGAASRGGPPQWLSSHPSGPNRIREIERRLPEVLPLYSAAARPRP